ncbi:hypothetical protein [Trinickia dinghuensis]|uniref:DUF4145 domain-containing protein n=1 Tax=Trinickia dinghuensis TaxID=2291023 RepID=A0A3D8JXV2_9BURK|nr:hypothetical protein [Trinickia dinghuensis]RDU97928.1 hypothetical protein DWV00_15430 [Trinickia dinghuensis]
MNTQPTDPVDPVILDEFLTSCPPGREMLVQLVIENVRWNDHYIGDLHLPEVILHCDSNLCGSDRVFVSGSRVSLGLGREYSQDKFLVYKCRNCGMSHKTLAVEFRHINSDNHITALFKYGEEPPFGPPLPQKLLKLAGDQRDILQKGRRCENQGLGIAASAYYRRVVESQKNRIFDEIIRVSRTLSAPAELIKELEAAKQERRFTQAVEKVKHGLPQVLLTNGHNPLTLLHNALSEGLHAGTDGDCLELATSIRIVLIDFVDRLSQAIKDDASLSQAVGRLLQLKQPKSAAQ